MPSIDTLMHPSDGPMFLAYVGMETDLIFTQGVDLPEFASFPLLETDAGRNRLTSYCTDLLELGREVSCGVILESPTWVANADRATRLGYDTETLAARNKEAVALLDHARRGFHDIPTVLSVNIGPRADAYEPDDLMTTAEARSYHAAQIKACQDTAADVISGYTLAYPQEAAGIVLAAKDAGLPAIISFTVETDGRLPTGVSLADAIAEVDNATQSYAAYYMVNCAHPDHLENALADADTPWMQRLRGIVANASRCSHAELDEAEELDAGDAEELGAQLAALHHAHPQIKVLGGCCGTDMSHMRSIATKLKKAS